jgi:hypothetical protein
MKKIIILSLLLISLSGCQLATPKELNEGQHSEIFTKDEKIPREINQKNCEGKKINFDFPPVNLEKTELLVPLGLMSGNHVTPVDHQYFQNFNNDKANIEVYSPASGTISSIGHMPNAPSGEDYRVIIDHTCTISSIYIHIDVLSEKLKKVIPNDDTHLNVRIPVEAGEVLGYYKTNVDYNVVDRDVVLPGLLTPEFYEGEPWKIHVPETIEYFNEPIKSKLKELSIRIYEPISGKLDYDIDGKLIGNWFLKDTNGYKGEGLKDYWMGHLSISPDHLDPNHIIFSIGNYDEKQRQFGVKENSPDPSKIGPSSGQVIYELVDYEYYTTDGKIWDRSTLQKIEKARNSVQIQGTVLLQLLEDRMLRLEIFPNKEGSERIAFTNNSRIYER